MHRELYIRGTRMQPYRDVEIQLVPARFNHLGSDILTALDFRGLCCFNYKLVDDRPVIFELNPRFGGSLPRDLNRLLDALAGRLLPSTT